MTKEFQTVIANDLKPGDELVNHGRIKSVKLTTASVAVIMCGAIESVMLGYDEEMTIEERFDLSLEASLERSQEIAEKTLTLYEKAAEQDEVDEPK